ncbi:hypothetical protein SFRURICE_004219, partial [Spodoptera frugiperda]
VLDPVTKQRVGTLTTKNHFAVLICLLRLPAYYTIRAITHVQVLCLTRKILLETALQNRQIKKALEYLKATKEYHSVQKKMPAFMKYEPPEPTPNMMRFRLPRKHEPDTEFLYPFTRLGFLSILRGQRMLIGYFNEGGILVYHPSSTAAYYLKGAFLMDVVACLPLENLESARKDSYDYRLRVTPTKQFLMLNRLIQLYRMPSAMMVLKEHMSRQDLLLVFQAIPLFMTMLNLSTCFIVFYSVNIFYSINDDGSYDWLIMPFDDDGGSWLLLFRDTFRFNLTETPLNLHVGTYFWVVYECSTTGYGVFQPSNIEIMQVLFIGIACSAMIITYYSVQIISIRANVNQSLASFQQDMKDINVYLAREKITGELQKETQRYYEYNWEKMGGIDYLGVLKLCDQITLRTDAILHIYGPTFVKCPILVNADISLLRILGRAIHSVYFLRDMKIIEHDDMVSDMYFVDYGGVEVRVVSGENTQIVRLPRGSIFGNLETLEARRSSYNVVATGRLHLLMIKTSVFATIAKDFPEVKELMNKSKTGIGKDNKMYVLGGEAIVKIRRTATMGNRPLRNKTSIIKYIYFQENAVQIYLMAVCLGCIYLDMFNAGHQINSTWMLATLYALDLAFFLKIFTQHSLPFLVPNKNIKKMMLPIRKMLNLARIEATVHKCIKRRKESITANLTVTTIVAVVIWFTLFVHATACLWHFIGMMEDSVQAKSSWMYMNSGESHCDNHYICSLYFVITTFTQNGVGDIIPKKLSEVIFVSILMILSTMIFMVYVGEFSSIIQYQSYRSFSFYSKYLELQTQGLFRNTPYTHSYETVIKSQVLTLKLDDWEYLLKHFPYSKNTIHKHMRQLGDDHRKRGNWPGGPPVDPSLTPARLTESTDLMDAPQEHSRHPGGTRLFESDFDQNKFVPPPSMRRLSHSDLLEEQTKSEAVVQKEEEEEAIVTVEKQKQKQIGFFTKVGRTAKKLMGRVSDPDILTAVSGEGKDELLLEEDEEATEALLAQFDAAKKLAEKELNLKKLRSRRKNMFKAPIEDENTEKQMFSLDIDEPGPERSESQPFVVRPLRIRDSETGFASKDDHNKDILNLGGRSKSKTGRDSMLSDGKRDATATTNTTNKEKELAHVSLANKTDEMADKRTATDTMTKLLIPTKRSSEIQLAMDIATTESNSTAVTTKESSLADATLGAIDSKTKRPLSPPTIGSSKAATGAVTSDVQVVIDMTEADSKLTEERKESGSTLKENLNTMLDKLTTSIEEKVGAIESKLHEDKTIEDKKTKEDAEEKEIIISSSETSANEEEIMETTLMVQTPYIDKSEPTPTIDAKDTVNLPPDPGQDIKKTQPDELPNTTEENVIEKALDLLYPDLETEKNLGPSSPQTNETLKPIGQEVVQGILKSTQAPPATSIQTSPPVTETAPEQASTSVQAAQHISKPPVNPISTGTQASLASTSVQVSKHQEDVDTPQEDKSMQAAQRGRDTTATKDVTGTQTPLVIKDELPNLGTKDVHPTKTDSSKSEGIEKLVSFLSETTIKSEELKVSSRVVDPQPPPPFEEVEARKSSFAKNTIIFEPTAILSENKLTPEPSLQPIKLPPVSASELKLTQYLSEEEIMPAIDLDTTTVSKTSDDPASAGPSKAVESAQKAEIQPDDTKKEETSAEEVKGKDTRKSPSRRFVRVRYEENDAEKKLPEILQESKDDVVASSDRHLNYFTMDSDEPNPTNAQQSANEDQSSQIQTSEPNASGVNKNKNASYKRRSD